MSTLRTNRNTTQTRTMTKTVVEKPPGLEENEGEWRIYTKKKKAENKLRILKPVVNEGLHAVADKREWVKIRFCVDSGAGETVVDEKR